MTKFKKQSALPCEFQVTIKGPLFHCRENSDHKYWRSGETLSVRSKYILKHLKSQNFKSCLFDESVIVHAAFS